MTKQYLNIFKLSFLTYILIILARPYITAQIWAWADMCLFLFIIAIIYQLLFAVYLRKKENIKIFFQEYHDCGLFGYSCGETYYGLEAIKNSGWNNLFYIPYLIFNIVLIVTYLFTDKLKGKISSKNDK